MMQGAVHQGIFAAYLFLALVPWGFQPVDRPSSSRAMPHNITLITTIAAGLGLALILGFLAVRLKLPALVGYLLAGVLIGPATPGFVADVALAAQLAEIGVMLLMFGVGLHFSLDDLLAVRAHRAARRDRADRGRHGARHRASRMLLGLELGAGAGVRPGAVGAPARSCCCARWRAAACSTRSTAASRSAGWWSRTW